MPELKTKNWKLKTLFSTILAIALCAALPDPSSGDTTAPTGSLNINSGASYTTSTSATLNLSASDSVGVTGYYISTSSSTPSSSASGWTSVTSTTSYSSNISYTLTSGDGSKTVYVWYKDSAGNVSSAYSDSITLDSTDTLITIWWDSGISKEKFGVLDKTTGNVTVLGEVGDLYMWQTQSAISGNILHVIGSDSSNQWKLYSLDTVTGSLINTVNITNNYYALAGVNSNGDLIVIWWDSGISKEKFGVLDKTTGNVTVLREVGDLSMWQSQSAISGNILYVIGSDSADQSKLYSLDTVTGSLINTVNVSYYSYALAGVNSNNGDLIVIWWDSGISKEKFGVLDKTTGNVTVLGEVGDLYMWQQQSAISGNTLYVIGSNSANQGKLYSLDITTGSLISMINGSYNNYTLAGMLDVTAPTTTASPVGGTYNGTQSVTLTCSDGTGSGCDKIYYTTNGTTPTTSSTIYSGLISISATTTLKFFAKDLAGNSEAVKTAVYTIDTTPPTGTISINSDAASTNSTSATLTLSCTDTSGCSEMQFSNDNSTWSTAEAYTTSKSWTLTTGDGTKTVYVKFKDTAGNWSTAYSDTIVLDVTAPTTTASPVGGTYNGTQSVTLTCSDGTGSGCDKIYYTTNGTTPTTSSTIYSGLISISATTTLKFFAKDLAGNSEAVKTESYVRAYNVTPSAGTNGSISPNTGQTVNQGSTIQFIVTPYTGYHVTSVTGCSGTLTGNIYTTGAITADCTVTANFAIDTHTVTTTATNGTITPTPTVTVDYNLTTTVSGTATPGYYLTGVSGCGISQTNTDQSITSFPAYTTGPITANCTVTATFAIKTLICTSTNSAVSGCQEIDPPGQGQSAASIELTNVNESANICITFNNPPSGQLVFYKFVNGSLKQLHPSQGNLSAIGISDVQYGGHGSGKICFDIKDDSIADANKTPGIISDPVVLDIDVDLPVLALSTLSDGAVTNNNTLNISGTVTDNIGVQGLTVNAIAVTVNTDGSFSHALVLSEGANIITTIATDLTGNETTDTRTITLDTSAPALVIDTPADNSKTAASTATVTGTIDETSTVTITLNGGTPQYASITENTFTLDIILAFGVNTIEVTATDTAGNTSTQKRTVTYDNTKPSLAITDPAQDIKTNQGSAIIKGTVSDTLTAVSVSVTVDGNTYTPTLTNGQFEQAVTFMEEKTYTIAVTATDEAGNETTVQRNIIYDITQPIIDFTVTTPTNNTSQTIPGTMEEGATATATSATATIGTVTYPSTTTWSINVTGMTEGSNTITATAKDTAGNETTVAKQIVVDTIAPATTASPSGGAYTSGQSVTLTANETATIYYTTDGSTPSTLSTVYTTPITVSSTKPLKFFAKDLAGNSETVKTENYTIDNVAPVLTLSTLSNGSVTNNNTLNISGTVTDNTGVQVLTVNGNAVTINTDGSFSHALTLNEGANIITTVVTDLAGNQTTDTRTITLDTTAPALNISTPADNSKTALSVTTVTGTVDENATVTITTNGGSPRYASVTGNTFTLDIVLAFGVNTIEITATDTAGNTSTQKRTVTYDNTKPSLAITDPAQDIKTNQGSAIIKGTVSDTLTAVSVSVIVDGNTYTPTLTNGLFEQTITFITEKTYTVTVTATDEAGNTTTAQRNIIYDITQPVINFTTTTPTNIASQTITGTMEEGATVIVTSATATIGTVTYPSSTTWRVNVTGMMEGSNTITATAKDAAGNETTVAKQIVVDTIAPVTTATPGGGTYSSAQGVTLVTNETATIYYTTDGTTPITLSTVYTTPITISTTTTLKFFAKDNAGNSSAVSSEIYTINSVAAIDTTPPSDVSNLTATSKDDGSIYLSWTAPSDADLKGYNVYRDGTKVNTGTIATTSYKDSDTTSGTTYTYKVTSLDLAENESTGATKSITAVVQDNTPPSAVSSIKVEDTKTGGSLKVVWTANTEADLSGYKVYLGTSSGSYTNTYEAGNTTAYTVTGLNDGAKYYIAVTAYDTDGNESAKSVESTESPTTATITLNPPTNLTVTTGNEYITLSWTGVSNVTGYLVYIGNTDGAYGTSARTTNTTYTYSNLNNNQTYYVAVSSYTNNGSSDTISAESERTASSGTPSDNNPPSSPTNITATTGTSGSVSLKWDRAEDSDISGYMLAYKESGSSTFTGMVSISVQWSYTITGLTDGVTYDFYLYAYDKNGNFSEPATTSATPTNSGTTADLTPPSPPILSAVPGDKKVTLIITASSDTDIDHYNLYVYNLASEKYMPLTSINGLTYEHSEGVGNGEALVYVATAVDASGNESGYSETASAVANELPGDIPLEEDPPVEGRVDGYDVNEMAKGFGTEIGELNYNPNADLDGDGKVDGNDQMIQGSNHGKKK